MEDKLLQKSVLSDELIQWGYRLFLDREPDNKNVIEDKKKTIKNSQELRKVFLESEEFKLKNQWYKSSQNTNEKAQVYIEKINSHADLTLLFEHIQKTWYYLGQTEPHWSVLSTEQFKQSNISNTTETFYETGKIEVRKLLRLLQNTEIDYQSFKSCLEYGCGVGRVTRWLAESFECVYAYDISASHLQLAKNYIESNILDNIKLRQIVEIKDIQILPQVDFIYSVIVLQHNPPPIIELIIRSFMKALNPGGVALFQVPTYRRNYNFKLQEYLSQVNKVGHQKIEMHILPQKTVFEIILSEGCKPIEVMEDDLAGSAHISNTFIVQKIV